MDALALYIGAMTTMTVILGGYFAYGLIIDILDMRQWRREHDHD